MQEKLASLLPPPVPALILASLLLWLVVLLVLAVARRGMRRPLLERLSLIAGVMTGLSIGILAVQTGPLAPRLQPEDILMRGRWWDTDLATLLAEAWGPAMAALGHAMDTPVQNLPPAAGTLAALAMVASATILAISLLGGQARRVIAMLAAAIGVAAALALLLPGIVLLSAWTVGQLNFWVFAAAGIAWQYWRHGHL